MVAGQIPYILSYLDSRGLFPNIRIHKVMQDPNRQLHADDITLSHLQMTQNICNTVREKKAFSSYGFQYILASFLNGADGPVARKMGTVTKEGGIKDAAVDRLSEMMVAELIAEQLAFTPERKKAIQTSFQLSTLTKAACEMTHLKTKDGGEGGMIHRRKVLYFILQILIKLNTFTDSKDSNKEKLIRSISKILDSLIEVSMKNAIERIKMLAKSTKSVAAPENSEFSGATEARKYAGVVFLNNAAGIDLVKRVKYIGGRKSDIYDC